MHEGTKTNICSVGGIWRVFTYTSTAPKLGLESPTVYLAYGWVNQRTSYVDYKYYCPNEETMKGLSRKLDNLVESAKKEMFLKLVTRRQNI